MRIIRFVTDDGRVLCGEDRHDGTATVVRDVCGALAAAAPSIRLSQLEGRTAIVADDDRNMRRLVCTVLEKAGCICRPCVDGQEAMDAIGNGPVDLIVSDIMMPHYNGYEIFSAAKAHDANLPVLLITGYGYDPSHSLLKSEREGLGAVLYKPFTPHQLLEQILRALESGAVTLDGMLQRTGERAAISSVLAPVRPSSIICIGRNWPTLENPEPPPTAAEMEVFLKPPTSVQANAEPVRLPSFEEGDPQVDGEGELAVVIGRTAENTSAEDAMKHVIGFTIANDITARRWQTASGPPRWMRGKGFDTFCPLGPELVTLDEIEDPGHMDITTYVNGQVVRRGSTADMLMPAARIISELSRFVRLDPGTVILTGAPPRVDGIEMTYLKPGDELMVEVTGVGRLVNPVAAAL